MVGRILFIIFVILIISFFLFQDKILSFIYNKVKKDNSVKELEDKDIMTPYKVFSYKLGGTTTKDKQEIIDTLSLRTELEIRKVMKDNKVSYALYHKNKEIGFISYSFIKQNFNDIFKGIKYHFVISKIETIRKKKNVYIKIWRENTSGFDLTSILKQIDYRIGDKVVHSDLGEGIVQEIRMNSVVVKFKKVYEIKDLKSLKLK